MGMDLIQEGKDYFNSFISSPTGQAIGEAFSPNEAEAFPLGKLFKASTKTLSGVKSTTAERLVGRSLNGKTIQDIQKGRGDWRVILYDDGTAQTLTKKDLHDLTRARGTEVYSGRFNRAQRNEDLPTQMQMALTSLDYHMKRQSPFRSRDSSRVLHERYLSSAQEMTGKAPDTVFVEYGKKHFQMPRGYAELLEKEGHLKITKTKVDESILKKFKR
jgi:hypothetical protein